MKETSSRHRKCRLNFRGGVRFRSESGAAYDHTGSGANGTLADESRQDGIFHHANTPSPSSRTSAFRAALAALRSRFSRAAALSGSDRIAVSSRS